ncbi:PH domain-containing protein [Microbacterium sp. NPDC056044]|uniref:PH domain-containing protein n=1 Tax=Microbacterium sp. NPDC056044 TaxID=3345690 RepID=UPI0035E32145
MNAVTEGHPEWQRLSARVVWVDVVVSILSLLPGAIAICVVGLDPSSGVLWPLAFIAVVGVVGAVGDILRWAFTSFRITDHDIERRTGLFVRRHRAIRRERVRSVDTAAKLRHRLSGLRVVTIGAGQQTGAGESALVLDALSAADAERLQQRLLATRSPSAGSDAAVAAEPEETGQAEAAAKVLATFQPSWVWYNMFSIWAYLMAAGLLWGAYWLVSSFGVDPVGIIARVVDWEAIGWPGAVLIGLVAVGVFGAISMGVKFVLDYGRFELSRVRSGDAAYLRTRRGLLSTREVNRDEARVRGMSIGEPLLWRWMGMADTNLITTGLNVWDPAAPSAILPRGPVRVARRVAGDIFGDHDPLAAPLTSHPPAALRRRLWWATAIGVTPALALTLPALHGAVPGWLPWATLGILPFALAGAWIANRALGHTVAGPYVVVRAGLLSRTTSALRRDAVSTVAVRQSVLQRRLGLSTVSAMTAAGWWAYEAADVRASDAVALAAASAPGLIDEFMVPRTPPHQG